MIREFIEKAVEKYNKGKLTPRKLDNLQYRYSRTLEIEYENKHKNLNNAHLMLQDTFTKLNGKRISKKLDFEWCENEKRKDPNPFYD